MGYPTDLLRSRAVVRPTYAILDPVGFCLSTLPAFPGCRVYVLATPAMGANFAEYLIEADPGTGTAQPQVEAEIQRFVYLLAGEAEVTAGAQTLRLSPGGFAYVPPGEPFSLRSSGSQPCRFLMVRRRHEPIGVGQPWVVTGDTNQLARPTFEGMESVILQSLLPDDLCFDLKVNLFTFSPGDSLNVVETHHETHGAYIVSGQGMYFLGDTWYPVKAGDFIWMGPYVPQAFYATGQGPASYLYTKDANREVRL